MPDTLMGGFWLTIIDMAVVFIVLWALALIIKAIKLAVAPFGDRNGPGGDGGVRGARGEEQDVAVEPAVDPEPATEAGDGVDAELAAVVSAAVAAYIGGEARGVVVSIAPAGREENLWAVVGRTRIMQSRELVRRRATA